jgi:hypothetical protein
MVAAKQVNAMLWSPGGHYLASMRFAHGVDIPIEVTIWKGSVGRDGFNIGSSYYIQAVGFGGTGDRYVVASVRQRVRSTGERVRTGEHGVQAIVVWNIENRREVFRKVGHFSWCERVAISRNGSLVAAQC